MDRETAELLNELCREASVSRPRLIRYVLENTVRPVPVPRCVFEDEDVRTRRAGLRRKDIEPARAESHTTPAVSAPAVVVPSRPEANGDSTIQPAKPTLEQLARLVGGTLGGITHTAQPLLATVMRAEPVDDFVEPPLCLYPDESECPFCGAGNPEHGLHHNRKTCRRHPENPGYGRNRK